MGTHPWGVSAHWQPACDLGNFTNAPTGPLSGRQVSPPGAQRHTGVWQFLWFVIVRRVEDAVADDPEVEDARVHMLKAP